MVAFETHNTDGTVIKEFGDNPLGYFIYDGTGHLALQVMENPAKKDPPISFAYFGTYRVDAAKGIVVHHVEGAVEGDGAGGPKVRRYIGKDELRPFRGARNLSAADGPLAEHRSGGAAVPSGAGGRAQGVARAHRILCTRRPTITMI